MKPELNPDEVIRRIIVMGRQSEIAALSFHHIIIAENLISIERAGLYISILVSTYFYIWLLHILHIITKTIILNNKKLKAVKTIIWIISDIFSRFLLDFNSS